MELIPKKDFDGKWGFVDKTDRMRINALYDSVEPFEDGYAKAVINGREIYLDKHGGWHDKIPEKSIYDVSSDIKRNKSPLDIFMDGCSKATDILHKGLRD